MEMDAPVQRYPTPKEPYLDCLPQLLALVCIGEHSVLGIVDPNPCSRRSADYVAPSQCLIIEREGVDIPFRVTHP
ncbi:hypothetical protein KIPB_016971, partial [Kipferlia bialata]|eukprot:g16971.t1